MNSRLLQKAFQREHRKRAFRISLIVHGIAIILLMINLYFKSDISEAEDEIQIDIISELPRQQKKKKVLPTIKKETELKQEKTPIPPVVQQKRTMTLQQKQTTVKHIQQTAAIQKMEGAGAASLQPDMQQAASKTADILEVLDTPDLSTDADLTPSPDSVLAPVGGDSVTPEVQGIGKRSGTFEMGSGKGTQRTLNITPNQTETGKTTGKGKTGSGTGGTTGKGKTGSGTGETFSSVMQQLADNIIQGSGGSPIDVVFVVDASGSMLDNIHAVAEHLVEMIDAYKASEIDYQLGLTTFNLNPNGTNNIYVYPMTNNLSQYKQMLYAIRVSGDEKALDAVSQTLQQMKFRSNTVKHLILLTDEPFSSLQNLTLAKVIKQCLLKEVYVNVLGENSVQHKKLAKETGGTWHAIPKDPIP